MKTLLGINIDHVATVRQARRETFPDPLAAAEEAVLGGATGITAHLREDRRHIQDADIVNLKKSLRVPLNMEMGADPKIVAIAEKVRPAWVCLVPEKREELTTEGGLDLMGQQNRIAPAVWRLKKKGIRVSLFVEADRRTVTLASMFGADAVELHTGRYAKMFAQSKKKAAGETARLADAAQTAHNLGLVVNAGHGIDYENVTPLLKAYKFHELNIGFAIVGRSLFVGMKQAVKEMKVRMNKACAAS